MIANMNAEVEMDGSRKGGKSDSLLMPCDRTRALVVDDDRSIALLFRRGIHQVAPQLEVDVAQNGRDAVQEFIDLHHGALVMDLHMPIMDGQRAFRRIRAFCRKKRWEMPSVLFCTAYVPPGSLRAALRNPAHGLLLKPVTGREVGNAVKSRLAMKRH